MDFNGHRRTILNKMDEIKEELAKERRQRVMDMSRYVKGVFQDRIDGKPRQNRLDDLPKGLLDMPKSFDEVSKKMNQAQDWFDANGAKLKKNLEGAYKQAQMVTYDPLGYLKAEELAIERIEKEEEEAKKKAEEESEKREEEESKKRNKARSEAKKEEIKALNERQKKEEEGADDEAKKRIEDKYKKEKEAIDKKYQDESDAISERRKKERELEKEREKSEEEHIKRLKETGEYYYGCLLYTSDAADE